MVATHGFGRRGFWFALFCALSLGWGMPVGHAWAETAVPPLSAAVTDLTGTLTAQQASALDARLKSFAQQRGSQVAVLLLPTTQPESIEQYSIRVADAWKIGRKGSDDGVIVVVAKDDRALRIEVGYGLEGAIPDAVARRIIAEVITPKFRTGDFNGGLVAGTDAIMKLIEGEKLPAPARGGLPEVGDFDLGVLFMALVILHVVGVIARTLMGHLAGSLAAATMVGVLSGMAFPSLVGGVLVGMVGFLISLASGGSGGSGGRGGGPGWTSGGRGWGTHGGGGGFGGGGSGGFGGGGGGFGGGGGGFGGGGASGNW